MSEDGTKFKDLMEVAIDIPSEYFKDYKTGPTEWFMEKKKEIYNEN